MDFSKIYLGLISGEETLVSVGLGDVRMSIAVEFARHIKVIEFDINEKRVNGYLNGTDSANEIGAVIKNTTVEFTSDPRASPGNKVYCSRDSNACKGQQ